MFERLSMEQIYAKMEGWAKGVTSKVTDFRVGSKVRTVLEAVAVVVEELYDRIYRRLKALIEESIYTIVGFNKIPATYASGIARFGKASPAEQDYFIPAGTMVQSRASQFTAPQKFRTTQDALLLAGSTYVDVPVVCMEPGTIGNIEANTLTEFVQKPTGIDTVTNPSAFTNGREEETLEEQKARFQRFIESQTRGILQSVEYGATLAVVKDENGNIVERVLDALAVEDLPARKGEVDLYIWNGVGQASEALIDEIWRIEKGYYDEFGNPVYGYKPAGIWLNIYSASVKNVKIQLQVTPESTVTLEELKPQIEAEIDRYFSEVKMGSTVIQTALEANIKDIEGIYDVKLYFSTDGGASYDTNNIVLGSYEVCLLDKPIMYV